MNIVNNNTREFKNGSEQVYFLSEVIGRKVILGKRVIGKLSDFIIVDKDKIAEVTHICISRPFGDKALLVPWEKVKSVAAKQIVIDIEAVEKYEAEPGEGMVMVKDHILDKKVLDVQGREVEVVYDVKMVLRNGRLYVVDVDLSRYGLLRRVGLKWLADFIYSLADKIRNQTVAWNYVQQLPEHISSFQGDLKLKIFKERLSQMPPVDLADILEELDHEQRVAIFDELDTARASDTLEELDPKVQRDMIASLKKEKAALLINEMTPAQAVDILSVLPWWEVKAILKLLNADNAKRIQSILEQQEEKIVNFAILDYMKFTPDKTVLQVRRVYQKVARGKDVIMYIYVVDEQDKLLGIIDFKEMLRANDDALLKDIMTSKVIALKAESTLREASELFARYGFRALPITDENNKMLGVIPYRDVMNLKHLFI